MCVQIFQITVEHHKIPKYYGDSIHMQTSNIFVRLYNGPEENHTYSRLYIHDM